MILYYTADGETFCQGCCEFNDEQDNVVGTVDEGECDGCGRDESDEGPDEEADWYDSEEPVFW